MEYSDRYLKNEACKVLIKESKEVNSKPDTEIFKKILNCLRSNADDNKPSFWYEIIFLQDQELHAGGCSIRTSQNEQGDNVETENSSDK